MNDLIIVSEAIENILNSRFELVNLVYNRAKILDADSELYVSGGTIKDVINGEDYPSADILVVSSKIDINAFRNIRGLEVTIDEDLSTYFETINDASLEAYAPIRIDGNMINVGEIVGSDNWKTFNWREVEVSDSDVVNIYYRQDGWCYVYDSSEHGNLYECDEISIFDEENEVAISAGIGYTEDDSEGNYYKDGKYFFATTKGARYILGIANKSKCEVNFEQFDFGEIQFSTTKKINLIQCSIDFDRIVLKDEAFDNLVDGPVQEPTEKLKDLMRGG